MRVAGLTLLACLAVGLAAAPAAGVRVPPGDPQTPAAAYVDNFRLGAPA